MRFVDVVLVIGLAGLLGCARALPPDRPTAALYRDLERLVTLREAAGWAIDRLETDELLAEALDSVCRVDRNRRDALLRWIDVEVVRRGGPVEEAWRRHGKRLSAVSQLLTLTRVRMVLDRAMTASEADCPFWLEPDEEFAGRQISDGRWQITFGGGGKGMMVRQDGRTDVSFGGAGRMLFGRVLGARPALYGGLELGASASFPRDAMGDRSGVRFGFDVVAPLVYRYTLTNAYLELEAGWLGQITEKDFTNLTHGVHAGAAVGGRASRARWLFPGAAFGVSWERTLPRAEQGPARTTIKVGFRVAFDFDL